MMRSKLLIVVSAVVFSGILAAQSAKATSTWTLSGSGDWNVATNWNGGIPGAGANAYINNGGTVSISSSDPTWALQDIRAGETLGGGATKQGYVNMTGGVVAFTGWLRMGCEASTTGSFTMSGGSLGYNATNIYINVGESGVGSFTMTGGTIGTIGSNYALLDMANGAAQPGQGGSGTMTVSGASSLINIGEVQDGNWGGTGAFNMSAGSMNCSQWFTVGRLFGSTAAITNSTTSNFTLTGGTVTEGASGGGIQDGWSNGAGAKTVGNLNISGSGQFIQNSFVQLGVQNGSGSTGGTGGVGNINLGSAATDTALFQMTASNGSLEVGTNAFNSGNINIVAGTMNLGSVVTYLGFAANSTGNLNMNGGTLTSTNSILVFNGSGSISISQTNANPTILNTSLMTLGQNSGSSGTATISGGKVTLTGNFFDGYASGARGLLNVSGGTISLLDIRTDSGSGTFNQMGGSITSSGGWIRPGIAAGSSGVYSISGGTDTGFGNFDAGESGSGTLNVSGASTIMTTTGQLRIGGYNGQSGGTGTVNLNGGTVTAQAVTTFGTGSSTLNFNGGTLVASASGTFIGGLTTTNVRNTAGTISNGGNNITISQNLLHSTIGGDNATDGGMAFSGAGTATLSGTNTYNGGTNITAGIVNFSTTSAIPASGQISIASAAAAAAPSYGAVFNNVAANQTGAIALQNGVNDGETITLSSTTNQLSFGAMGTATFSGVLNTSGSAVYLGGAGGTLNFAAGISGSTGLTLGHGGGSGTIILSGSNAYTGATTVPAGSTLSIAYPGASTYAGSITDATGLSMSAGSATLAGTVSLGNLFTNFGTTTITGSVNTSSYLSIGQLSGNNSTVVVQGTGSLTTASGQDFNISDVSPSIASLTLQGASVAKGGTLYVGKSGTDVGILNLSGGSFSGAGGGSEWRVGGGASGNTAAYGNLVISGSGALTGPNAFQIGAYGLGVLNQTGGTLTSQGYTDLGRFSTGFGVGNVSGGQWNATGGATLFFVGEDGNGVLNLSGTGLVTCTNGMVIGNTAAAGGVVNLMGGTLATTKLSRSGGTMSVVNFNGGTLKASAANATFMTGLNNAGAGSGAFVWNGGGTIDNGGFAISIGQGLLAPTGSGISSIALTASGSGYQGEPVVQITGGGGTGATARAIMSGGQITGFQITNPGTGYTTAPTVTIAGGGATSAGTAGAVSLLANSSTGGLTFTGTGATTLSNNANSFAGNLVVNGGTLVASTGNNVHGPTTSDLGNVSLASRSITVNSGGVLDFTAGNVLGSAASLTDTVATPLIINAGGTVTNLSGGGDNILGNVTLSGGTLTGVAGASSLYATWHLAGGSVTVNTAPSVMTASGTFSGYNMASPTTTFNVAATGGAAPDLTVSAPLLNMQNNLGTSALFLTGGGKMTLSAVNTYSGNTTVNSGTLALANASGNNIASSPAITINSGSMLDATGLSGGALALGATQTLAGAGTVNGGVTTSGTGSTLTPGSLTSIGTLNTGNLDLSSGGILNFELGTPGVSATSTGLGSLLNVSGSVTLPGTQIASLNLLNNNGANGQGSIGSGYYDLINYTGALTGSPSAAFGTGSGAKIYNYSTQSGATNQLVLQISILSLNWTGLSGGSAAADSGWNLTSTNWANGSNASPYFDGAVVAFGDTNAVTGGSISNGNVTLGSVFAPTSITFSNSAVNYTISGSGGITGATGITLNGTGVVSVGTSNSFTSPVAITAGELNISNNAALGNSSGATVSNGGALQLQGGIAVNAISLALNGAGWATSPAGALNNASGNNTYSGAITLGSSAAIGSTSGTLTIAGGINNSGNLLTITGGAATSISSPIVGGGGLFVTNSSTVALSVANAYAGATTVNSGILQLGTSAAAIPTGATAGNVTVNGMLDLNTNSATINGLSGSGSVTSVAGGTPTLTVGNNNVTSTFSGAISDGNAGSVALKKIGSGTLVLAGPNSFSGAMTVSAGGVQVGAGGSAGKLASLTASVASGASLAFIRGDSYTNGTVISNSGSVTSLSSGTVTMLGTIANSGVVSSNGSGLFVLGGNVTGGTLANLGGTLDIQGASNSVASLLPTTGTTIVDVGASLTASAATLAVDNSPAPSLALAGTLSTPVLSVGNTNGNSGVFTQTGGVLNVTSTSNNYSFTVGNATGSSGTLNVTGGTINATKSLDVYAGTGNITVSSTGASPTVLNLGTWLTLGDTSGTGSMTQNGGIVSATNDHVNLGFGATAMGTYTMHGGTLSTIDIRTDSGTGTYYQDGGLANVTVGWVRAGVNAGSHANYTLAGGTLTVGGANTFVGENGTGMLTIGGSNGGTFLSSAANSVTIGSGATSAGTLNLQSGGLLRTTQLNKGSGSATFNWSGGTLQNTSGANLSVTAPATLSGAATVAVDGGQTATFQPQASISGMGGLTKVGAGVMVMSASNSYSGPTNINGGTLRLNDLAHRWSFNNSLADSIGSSTATITSQATATSFGTLGANSVSLGGGAHTTSQYVSLGSNIVPTTTSGVTIELWATQNAVQNWGRIFDFGASTSNYAIMSWTQGTTLTSDRVQWSGGTASVSDNTMAPYTLGQEYHIAMVFTPSGAGTQVNWYSAPANASTITAKSGSFFTTNTLAGLTQTNMWLGQSEFAGDNVASASYDEMRIWNSPLSTTVLNSLQTAGPDAISAAVNLNVLPVNQPVTMSGGGTLDLNSLSQTISSLTSSDPTTAVTLGGGILTTGSDNTNTTFAGNISGAGGGITKVGSGTFTLSGVNSFSGPAYIGGGVLQMGSSTGLTAAALTANSGTLDLNSFSVSVSSLSGSAGVVTDNSASMGTSTLTLNQTAVTTFSGLITDGGTAHVALTMNGAGRLTLPGSNAYSGNANINSGAVVVSNAAALGSGSVAVAAGGRVELSGNITMTQNLAIAGNGSSSDGSLNGALRSTSGTNTWAGNIVLSDNNARVGTTTNSAALILSGTITSAAPGDGLLIRSSDNTTGVVIMSGVGAYQGVTDVITGTLQSGGNNVFPAAYPLVMGNTNGASNTFDTAGWNQTFAGLQNGGGATNIGQIINSGGSMSTITLNQTGASTFSGTIQGNTAIVNAAGVQMLANTANSYSGGATISGGTLEIVQNALGSANFVNIGPGTLDVVSNIVSSRNVNLTDPAAAIQVESGVSYNNSGLVSGTGGLTKNGPGLLSLAGTANAYSGTTTVNAGTLQLASTGALGTGSVAANGGVLDLDGNSVMVPSFSGAAGVVTDSSAAAGTTTFTVSQTGSTVFGGSFQDGPPGRTISLALAGGNLTLTGTNAYSGATNVSGGSLVAGAAGAFSPNSAFSVTGGTLDVSLSAQSINSLSMGTLGALNLGIGNILSVTNAATLAGTLNIHNFSSGTQELMAYSSESGTFGTVTGLVGNYQLFYGMNQLDIVAGPSGPPTWQGGSGLSWTTAANWNTGSVPNGIGAMAVVGTATNTNVTITLDTPQTLGSLTFTNSANSSTGYTLAAGTAGSLTLNNSGSAAQIVIASGTHGISAPVSLVGGDLIVSASNNGVLNISGSISQDLARNLTLGGDGTSELILSGTNNLGGSSSTATVASGTLVLNDTEALADGTSLTVGDASFFGGIQPAGGASASSNANAPLAISPTIAPVPEPGTLLLLAGSALALTVLGRRRRRLHVRRGEL